MSTNGGTCASSWTCRRRKDAALPIAVAIGLDPAISIAAGARYDGDELYIAGAIRGEGVKVSRGVTVDIDIPAEAEIVIEGLVPPHEREGEGPLAEFHGYFGRIWESPKFEVTAICWRDDPIFQTIIPGWTEHVYIGNVLPREPLLLNFARHVSKNVIGVHLAPYGSGFLAIVSLDKKNPGEPKNVAMGVFTAHVNIKWCIVVDGDVDIYDPADVMWALTTRVDWGKDIFLVPGAQGHEMDPTADTRGVHVKIGVDATADKGRREAAERCAIAKLIWASICRRSQGRVEEQKEHPLAILTTKLFDILMPSPFILASGPLSYDATGMWEAFRAGAGGVTTKTLRLEAAVNPTPHMVVPRSSNLRATLFNTEKWADLPWEQWVEQELPAMAGHPGVLIASIGHTAREGEIITRPVSETGVVNAIECVAYTKDTMIPLIRAVRERTDLPILAKLTFNWGDDLYPAAEAALEAGANGFTAIDSLGPTLQIDIETRPADHRRRCKQGVDVGRGDSPRGAGGRGRVGGAL